AGPATTTANDNAFYGAFAGLNSNSSFNSFFGSGAGQANTTGNQNSFFGYQAGNSNFDGGGNAFFGESAGSSNVSGFGNAFFGTQSGNKATGSNNSFFGTAAGNIFTSGSNNVFAGFNTGSTSTTESNNTLLGFGADINVGINYSTALGTGAKATLSHTIVLGTVSETVVIPGLGAGGLQQLCRNAQNQISPCSSSRRYKTNIAPFVSGLNLVNLLQPVTFNWRANNQADFGLVAEDVAAINPLLVTYNEKGEVEGVKYDRVSMVLLNAVKQQQTQIEKQNEQIKNQQQTIDALKKLVCAANREADICREEK
ncbi:MAG TPA: tail fiber domain-containing protein, partial [Pyrinomonadaceae bacterium]